MESIQQLEPTQAGSVKWLGWVIDTMRSAVEGEEVMWSSLDGSLVRFRNEHGFEKLSIADERQLFEEWIGVTPEHRWYQELKRRYFVHAVEAKGEAQDRGRPAKSTNVSPYSGAHTRSENLARRLKRDAPEIYEKWKAGKYPSTRAAAVDAGIVTPERTKRDPYLPQDATRAADKLMTTFGSQWCNELTCALRELIDGGEGLRSANPPARSKEKKR